MTLVRPVALVVGPLLFTVSFTAPSTFTAQGSAPAWPNQVVFSTYLGGSEVDRMKAIAVDSQGRVHVAGGTCSDGMPVTADALQRTRRGFVEGSATCDGYLAIFSPAGALIFGTYIGGSYLDGIDALALDGSGNIYLAGHTVSADFPTTEGAYDRTCGYDGACTSMRHGGDRREADLFVMKLGPLGRSIVYSTYVGGGDHDQAGGLAVDGTGQVHVAGATNSRDFPWTPGAPDQSLTASSYGYEHLDAFYSRLSADGSGLLYSTYLGGSGEDRANAVALDADGNAYVGGATASHDFPTALPRQPFNGGEQDGWIARFTAAGAYDYGSYLGGEMNDRVTSITARGGGVYLAGGSCSANFPHPRPASCAAYLGKMTPDGSLLRSVIVPGNPFVPAIVADDLDRLYVTGTAWHPDFPTTPDAAQPAAQREDAILAVFDMREGQGDAPLYGTFFGGSAAETGYALAIDGAGNAYIAGDTTSADFPVVNAADGRFGGPHFEDREGFAVKLSPGGIPREDIAGEVVLYASDADHITGAWNLVRDLSAAGGARLWNPDAAAPKGGAPLAVPHDYVDFTFTAEAGVPYRLWIRGKAENDHWANDSVFVQFSDSVDDSGQPVWRIGTASGTSVNLEDAPNAGLAGWGWQDNGYGAGVLGLPVRFAEAGAHTIRIQPREDGFSLDQIVLSTSRYFHTAPGATKGDSRVLARSNSDGAVMPPDEEPPPGTCDTREIVLHPGASASLGGAWVRESDPSAASQHRVRHPNAGAPRAPSPAVSPANYFDITFDAEAGVEYRLWMRGRADNDHWANDSVFVQFTNTIDQSGSAIWRIGTASGTTVNVEDCSGCGLRGWGWQDNGYGAGTLGPVVRFAAPGRQTLRVQTREDGVAIDQIVLSSAAYASQAPGALKNDATILPACGDTAPPHSSAELDVLRPLAGEELQVNAPFTIRWMPADDGAGIAEFDVFFSQQADGPWSAIPGCTDVPPELRSCIWYRPGPVGDGFVKVVATTPSGQAEARSDMFQIVLRASGDGGTPPGWSCGDIGAVTAGGSCAYEVDDELVPDFVVEGSGADIWGTADEFSFARYAAYGDFSLTARVLGVENVHRWTKAGIMIRDWDGLTPAFDEGGGRHASFFVTPGENGTAFQRRPAEDGVSVHTAGPTANAPVWLKLVRTGDVIRAYFRKEATDAWTLVGTQTFAGLPYELSAMLVVTSHVDGTLATGRFDNVIIEEFKPMQSADIGTATEGTTASDGVQTVIEGNGHDIWGTSDGFRYHYVRWNGNGHIRVRVRSLENTDPWAKAGVMIRETLAPDSKHVIALVSASRGLAVQSRSTTGGATASTTPVPRGAPVWLGLRRYENGFQAGWSEDGEIWQSLGGISVTMGADVFIGLAVTSHASGTLATAVFDDVVITP